MGQMTVAVLAVLADVLADVFADVLADAVETVALD